MMYIQYVVGSGRLEFGEHDDDNSSIEVELNVFCETLMHSIESLLAARGSRRPRERREEAPFGVLEFINRLASIQLQLRYVSLCYVSLIVTLRYYAQRTPG